MSARLPKWMQDKTTTRSRSGKQESKISKDLSGRTTVNSGATFGENDVVGDWFEVEAKTTAADSFRLTQSDWQKLGKKCKFGKMPIFVIDFENVQGNKGNIACVAYEDLKYLLSLINKSE